MSDIRSETVQPLLSNGCVEQLRRIETVFGELIIDLIDFGSLHWTGTTR